MPEVSKEVSELIKRYSQDPLIANEFKEYLDVLNQIMLQNLRQNLLGNMQITKCAKKLFKILHQNTEKLCTDNQIANKEMQLIEESISR